MSIAIVKCNCESNEGSPDLESVILCVQTQRLFPLLEEVHLHVTQSLLQLRYLPFALSHLPLQLVLGGQGETGRLAHTHQLLSACVHSPHPHTVHLVLCGASVLLQHLHQIIVFSIKLGDLPPVELQQLSGGAQVGQALSDGGQGRVLHPRGVVCLPGREDNPEGRTLSH